MGHVQINLFGSFHVERDGKSVDEQLARSPKGMLLMQYLILAPRQTAEAKTLMQVMWPEENSTSPDTALKTLISRQRALLREISPELAMCLVTVRGGYRWVCPPEVSVDVLEFEEMLARMKLPGGATPSEEMLTRMLVLYQGRLLADQQPQPAWLYNRSERLHQQFLQTVDSRLAQLQQAGHVHRYVALVRRAIDADPTNEALQQRLIEGLRQTERDTDADQQVELAARLNSAARDEMMADYYEGKPCLRDGAGAVQGRIDARGGQQPRDCLRPARVSVAVLFAAARYGAHRRSCAAGHPDADGT